MGGVPGGASVGVPDLADCHGGVAHHGGMVGDTHPLRGVADDVEESVVVGVAYGGPGVEGSQHIASVPQQVDRRDGGEEHVCADEAVLECTDQPVLGRSEGGGSILVGAVGGKVALNIYML